jgi:hypothetical protein
MDLRPLVKNLALSLALSCVVGGAAVAFLHTAADGPNGLKAAIAGAGAIGVAGALGLMLLSTFSGQPGAKVAMGLLGCSMVRIFGALVIGLGLVKLGGLDARPFWFALLAAGLLALALETIIAMKALGRPLPQGTRP